MLEFVRKSADDRQDAAGGIATRLEKTRILAANSEIGGDADGHGISRLCKQILRRISSLH